MKKKAECCVDNCNGEAYYKASQLCKCCYSSLYYWRSATPTELIRRKQRLKVFEARMDVLQPATRVVRTRKRA